MAPTIKVEQTEKQSFSDVLNALANLVKVMNDSGYDIGNIKPDINEDVKPDINEENKLPSIQQEKNDTDEIEVLEVVKISDSCMKQEKVNTNETKGLEVVNKSDPVVEADIKINVDEIKVVGIVTKDDKLARVETIDLEDGADTDGADLEQNKTAGIDKVFF